MRWENKAPSGFATSPKYDIETFYDHCNFVSRILGRLGGGVRLFAHPNIKIVQRNLDALGADK